MPTLTQTHNIWDQVAKEYEEFSYDEKDANYPANTFRSKILLDFFKTKPKGRVLDAGCGTGFMTRTLLKLGYEVVSVDSSKEMLSVAEEKTQNDGLKGEFHFASVDNLRLFEDASFDFVMLNGVLPYFTEEAEVPVYEEISRVLKRGGYLVCSHYNLFFDLFRMDKYTVSSILGGILNDEKLNSSSLEIEERLNEMLADAEYPCGDVRTMKVENPLIYKNKLEAYDFSELSQSFYNFYLVPPRVKAQSDNEVRKYLEETYRNDWRGLFLAKTFVSIAQKN